MLKTGLDEGEALGVEVTTCSDLASVDEVLDVAVLRLVFKVGLEVVSVELLLLGEASEEVGVVFGPSFTLAVEHPLLAALVVFRVAELAGVEFLDLVEEPVELLD